MTSNNAAQGAQHSHTCGVRACYASGARAQKAVKLNFISIRLTAAVNFARLHI